MVLKICRMDFNLKSMPLSLSFAKKVFMKSLFSILMIVLMAAGCIRLEPKISETKVLAITENVEGDIIYEMGIIETGKRTILELKLKNTLQKPFVINDVIRFCGCTIPEFETTPILPQKYSVVKITFIADHLGLFSKSIKIYLNTQEKPVQILFRGEIISKSKEPK